MSKHYLTCTANELDEAVEKVLAGYGDVTQVTASAGDVRVGKKIVDVTGEVREGTLNTADYYNSGYSDGVADGNATGYSSGYSDGHCDGYSEGYKEGKIYDRALLYIESSGTQAIDTGYYAKPSTSIEIVNQLTNLSVQQRLFSTMTTFFFECYINGAGNYAFAYQDGSGNWINTGITADTGKHMITFDGYNKVFMIDNKMSNSLSSYTATATSTSTVRIFASTATATSYYSKMRLYHCRIYEAGNLVRDYIPVLDFSGVPCLFDRVNRSLHYNIGTGTFTYA